MKRILVIGSTGQIGSELAAALGCRYGNENVIAGYHERLPASNTKESCIFEKIDCRDFDLLDRLIVHYNIGTIYHLAALLSARGEQVPMTAWDVNVNGLLQVLENARNHKCAVFFPSSIGAFGPDTPKIKTPQNTIQRPTTVYGVSKISGELLCAYYHLRYGIDTRSLRFPGLISYKILPGGGTTDYAVEIFHSALRKKAYSCYLRAGTFLDMMYMPDAIRAAIELMEADAEKLKNRNAYNVTAMSIDPEMLAAQIRLHIPDFSMTYDIDPIRQVIADSWPDSMDDSAAREEWNWQPSYNLKIMVPDMLENLGNTLFAEVDNKLP